MFNLQFHRFIFPKHFKKFLGKKKEEDVKDVRLRKKKINSRILIRVSITT